MKRLEKKIILAGKAASGKDYLRDEFIRQGYRAQVSVTTRPMRIGEKDGDTYHFLSETEWSKWVQQDLFWERKTFNGWKYGTLKTEWEGAEIFIFTPSGIKDIPKDERDDCHIIYINIDEDIRRERLKQRSDADKVERRIRADEADFYDFTDWDEEISDPNFDPVFLVAMLVNEHGKEEEAL